MQTSLARRQRHRRSGRRPSGGGTARAVAIALPLFLFGTFVLVGVSGLVAVVAAYNHYAEGLPDPQAQLANLDFEQQTKIYDRTGDVELARFGDFKREVVSFSDIPPELVDATTSIEDKTFWENSGFDPIGIISAGLDSLRGRERGASTITQQLVRSRLLPASAFEGSVYERKIREIIQSVRLTQAFPGSEGKQRIMEAYLNQNFYGNQSYGVAAAAKSYFGKPLSELSLAQMAILAGIPQSPTTFDLVRNAIEECSVEVADGADCPAGKSQLVVPADSEIVQRRDYILELMKTRSVLSGDRHTAAEYEAAKAEPVILAPQVTPRWKAAQFVYQVQQQLGEILCGADAANGCEAVQTGGYQVVTTLDLDMQASVEKWLYVAARAPNLKNTDAVLSSYKIPKADQAWIKNLRQWDIQNGAAAVEDARTGQILAYAGSAGYFAAGNSKFQPQFDVLSDGYRQPGSAIKPIDYSIGIEDRTMTASTLFMDVVTDFGTKGKPYIPTQADSLERGPVRLREALQISLNIPAIKSGLINGIDHQFTRTQDFGLRYQKGAIPVTSMSIGTLESHPIDMLAAYSALANGGVRVDRQMILEIKDSKGDVVWPAADTKPTSTRVVSAGTAYIMSDILKGNTDPKVNVDWAKWDIVQGGVRRDAAYKTGTTQDTRDVTAYGFLAPPKDPKAAQLVVGVWLGNSNNHPTGVLSLDASAPVWSRIMRDVSAGLPRATFDAAKPKGIVTAKVDAYSGMLPGPFTTRTINEVYLSGTAPTTVDDTKVAVQIDAASGLLWQDGCIGPVETKGFLDLTKVEPNFPAWKKSADNWIARARKGVNVRGGLKGTRTTYFARPGFNPFGKTWGAPFAPTKSCTPGPPPPCASVDPNAPIDPSVIPTPCTPVTPQPSPEPTPPPASPKPSAKPLPKPSPSPKSTASP
jgi:membrane peptidoglycan carboxypeptidase